MKGLGGIGKQNSFTTGERETAHKDVSSDVARAVGAGESAHSQP